MEGVEKPEGLQATILEGWREGGGRLPNRGVVEPSELLEAQGPGGRRLGTGHQRWRWRMDV